MRITEINLLDIFPHHFLPLLHIADYLYNYNLHPLLRPHDLIL